jgi:phosphocarrier protein HPr
VIQRRITIVNALGLHARAAARFVGMASRFKSDITVTRGHQTMDGKSIFGVLLLAAAPGTVIEIGADGPDQHEAVAALCHLIEQGFEEA